MLLGTPTMDVLLGTRWLLAYHGFVFSSGMKNLGDYSYSVDDVIVLEIEVKGMAEPFQVLLEPYALIIPGESYIGITVKKEFKVRHPLDSSSWPR